MHGKPGKNETVCDDDFLVPASTQATNGRNPWHQHNSNPVKKLSVQMCAVFRIVTADQVLSDAAFRYINILDDSIDWEPVLALTLTQAKARRFNSPTRFGPTRSSQHQLFEEALSMSPDLKRACVKALGIRWNL